jgi:RNA polymerase sigma-70 factor, ECF subfamily
VDGVEAVLAAAFRDEWGRIVATLIRTTGDWDLAEECAQDAFARALERWPSDGVPRNPGAWLTTVARNRAVDRLRREAVGAAKARAAVDAVEASMLPEDPDHDADGGITDDRLRLVFTCCHPALALDARVALTLRTLTGLTTAEIARAFLVPETTMAQRLVRARRKIRHAAIPYRVPSGHLLTERLPGVLAVIYLLFNEGYSVSSGPNPRRVDLAEQAQHLARTLAALMPDEPEVLGLLALVLLQHARRGARVDAAGELVTLEHQDRSLWDRVLIDEGVSVLEAALRRRRPGPYQVQAAIAACHGTATTPDSTDWAQIAALYAQLAIYTPSPVVELNRAAAVAMADGPAAGLALIDGLAERGALPRYHLLPAARADLLRRLDRRAEAVEAYRAALALDPPEADARYLRRRVEELTHRDATSGA